MHQKIQSMLEKHAIEETTSRGHGFLSTISLVPNKGGGQRPVINLKSLNNFVYTEHFKMEGIHAQLIQLGMQLIVNIDDLLSLAESKELHGTMS